MGDIQHIQWRPASIMERTLIQRTTCETCITTKHYQWKKEYKVKEVWNHRKWECDTQFLVHWKGYGNEHDQ